MKALKFFSIIAITLLMSACATNKEVSQEDIAKHNDAVEQLAAQNFMIKAQRLVLNKRSFPAVTSGTNFIVVDGKDAIVQISPGMGGGPNGVGGFTVKGIVSGYEMKIKNNGNVIVKYNVTATAGSCTVFINLPKDGSNANVTINNTLHGKNAEIYGPVTEIDNSIFVGRTRP